MEVSEGSTIRVAVSPTRLMMDDVRGLVAFLVLVGLGAWSAVRLTRTFDWAFRRLEDIELTRRGACFPARPRRERSKRRALSR
jgi:hypothetical protein